jgi:formate-dependent nitrite reductase membrane component NrfD
MRKILPTLTQHIWFVCFVVLMVAGVYAAYDRMLSLRSSPAAQMDLPWSLPAALNVVCGIALAAGGFTVAATIRGVRVARAQSLMRINLISAFLGYLVACLGFLADQTVVTRISALNPNWTSNRVSFAVNCGFVLFGVSMLAEFAPDFHLPSRWRPVAHALAFIRTPLLWMNVLVSLSYQWIVGDALQLTPNASRFWASPWLALLFFISGTCAALAVGLMASLHSQRSSSNPVDLEFLNGARRVLATFVFLYIYARLGDLLERGQLSLLRASHEGSLLTIEIALFLIPMLILASQTLPTPGVVYYCSAAILAGFISNRLNTFITSLEATTQTLHLATWHEFAISYSILAVGVVGFHHLTNRLQILGVSRAEEV